MRKKGLYGVFVGLFLAICLTFSLGTLAFGTSQAGANEQLQRQPAWLDKNGKRNDNVLSDTAAWVNDHFFLRQELVSTDHYLTGALFRVSGVDSVILGKDGWLYYGPTADSYAGLSALTEREVFAVSRNLFLMQQYCRSQGKEFAFLVAPNKNSLYPQYMPELGVQAAQPDGIRVLRQLEMLQVQTVDIYGAFAKEPILYYKTDSHWNPRGAALAADLVNQAFGRTSGYYAGPFQLAQEPYTGDLYEMLYPAFSGTEQQEVFAGRLVFSYEGNAQKPDSITLRTVSDKDGSLLAYRDSFGNLLYPYLADSYGTARFSRSTTYDLTGTETCVLLEIVERNLRTLTTNLPVMPSPLVEADLPAPSGETAAEQDPKAKAPEGFCLWRGALPQQTDATSLAYVGCGEQVYEAFLTENNGFAVYLPEGMEPEILAFQMDGSLYSKTIVS